jgi:hypothetical protein
MSDVEFCFEIGALSPQTFPMERLGQYIADLGAMLSVWGPCTGCRADLNGDGRVDGNDLGILLAAW